MVSLVDNFLVWFSGFEVGIVNLWICWEGCICVYFFGCVDVFGSNIFWYIGDFIICVVLVYGSRCVWVGIGKRRILMEEVFIFDYLIFWIFKFEVNELKLV